MGCGASLYYYPCIRADYVNHSLCISARPVSCHSGSKVSVAGPAQYSILNSTVLLAGLENEAKSIFVYVSASPPRTLPYSIMIRPLHRRDTQRERYCRCSPPASVIYARLSRSHWLFLVKTAIRARGQLPQGTMAPSLRTPCSANLPLG